MEVLGLILTYNRCDLLKLLLDRIKLMSEKPNHLYIVDNNSDDDTKVFLSSLDSDYITVFSRTINDGSSGGFAFGISRFLESNYNFVWILDDDGLPTQDCLLNLKKSFRDGLHFYSSRLVTFDDVEHFDIKFVEGQNIYDHRGGPFNSILVTRFLIENVGNVRADMFIWGDEYEWLTRIENHRFHKVLVYDSVHIHKTTAFAWHKVPRVFYLVRNRILIWKTIDPRVKNKFSATAGLFLFILKLLWNAILHANIFQVREILKGIWSGYRFAK